MSEGKPEAGSGAKVTIILAVIGLVGTLGTAFFANIDKIFPSTPVSTNLPTPVAPNPGYPKNMRPLELQTNRHGSDFSPNPERTESAEGCARLCSETPTCKAMTFVQSPNNLPGGSCWLKTSVPPPTPRSDMISAVKFDGV